jgi:hypothetical protein
MPSKNAWITDLFAAVLVPFIVCGAYVLLADRLTAVSSVPWVIVRPVAATLGFVFVVRRLKVWALPIALAYFPLLHVVLLRFSLMLTCYAFDRCL